MSNILLDNQGALNFVFSALCQKDQIALPKPVESIFELSRRRRGFIFEEAGSGGGGGCIYVLVINACRTHTDSGDLWLSHQSKQFPELCNVCPAQVPLLGSFQSLTLPSTLGPVV